MGDMFKIKASDLVNLRKFYKRAPRQFAVSASNVLNSFAFGTRKEAINVIHNRMTVRNDGFVNRQMKVNKARPGKINKMESEAGSVATNRFTGWAEQELGTKPEKDRAFNIAARKGDITNQAMPSARMKPSNRFIKPSEFGGDTPEHRVLAMLQVLSRRKTSRAFIIRKSKKFRSGVYKMINKKVVNLQNFKTKQRPKRVRWLSEGRANYFKRNKPRDVWASSLRRVLKFR